MKSTNFKWAWGDHEPQADKTMTRERAARLLKAWRRSKTQGARNFTLQRITHGHTRFYVVGTTQYMKNEAGVLVIE